MNISEEYNWQCLTPETDHCYFGYYDRCAWNADNSKHLSLRVGQCEHLPLPGETAEIGYVARDGKGFVKLTETRAWCHQQGAMTLWLKHRPGCFVYNDFDPKNGKLYAKIYELETGIVGKYDMPVYAMSPDGRWGVSLNFSRIPRRGYSYADVPVPDAIHPDLDNDGIFLIDMYTGDCRLLCSYREIAALHPTPYELDDVYWWLNHTIFNCDSTRLLFLFRTSTDTKTFMPWKTHMYTIGLDRKDLSCPLPHFYWNSMISHQIWGRTPYEVLLDANWRGTGSEYVVFDERKMPLQAQRVSNGMGPMGHLVFSPDGQWMLADTYPSKGIQQLAMVQVSTGDYKVIGRFRHEQPKDYPVDVRCDLHPRWTEDGSLFTVDTIHTGNRAIYLLETAAVTQNW